MSSSEEVGLRQSRYACHATLKGLKAMAAANCFPTLPGRQPPLKLRQSRVLLPPRLNLCLISSGGNKMHDKDLCSGLIRLHVLSHACQEPIFGAGIIEELARHGYRLSPGTL